MVRTPSAKKPGHLRLTLHFFSLNIYSPNLSFHMRSAQMGSAKRLIAKVNKSENRESVLEAVSVY